MRKFLFLFLCLAVFAAGIKKAAADNGGNYTAEVRIDITSDNAANARDKGMKEAYRSAFMAVASRTTNEEGLARLENLTDEQLINFIKEATVVSEKASDVRYIATLRITINNDLLKTFMQEQNINYVVTSPSNVLVIPVFREYAGDTPLLWEEKNLWRKTWETTPITSSPNIYVSIPEDSINTMFLTGEKAVSLDGQALDKISAHMGTENIFVLDALYNGIEGLKITILPYHGGNTRTVNIKGARGPELFGAALPEIVRQIDEEIHKNQIDAGSSPHDIMVLFDSRRLSDWLQAEKKIKEINIVSSVKTIAMGKGKVQALLTYIGSLENLTRSLREKSLILNGYDNFYTLESIN